MIDAIYNKLQTIVFEVPYDTLMLSADNIAIYDSFNYINWYTGIRQYDLRVSTLGSKVSYASIRDLALDKDSIPLEDSCIPVGSIEYVETIMGKHIKPTNIPIQLREKQFTDRYVADINREELNEYLNNYKELFVKDSERVKGMEPMVARYGRELGNLSSKLFISEVINIKAEWRVFVFRGEVLDCKQYLGKYTDEPDYALINKMVSTWKKSPTAYTLDVGLLDNGKTVIIEAHNFISCGLYGFNSGNKLALMISVAYKEEKLN